MRQTQCESDDDGIAQDEKREEKQIYRRVIYTNGI